jgi:uncharacterized membrane protein YvbJ
MRCSKCGSDSPAGKKFCGDCGAPLENLDPEQAQAIYNWFSEGFDLLDLKKAKALLDELGE